MTSSPDGFVNPGRLGVVCCLAWLSCVVSPASPAAQRLSPESSCTAIVGASVISMEGEGILQDRTVLVRGERIAAVGPPAEVHVPQGCEVIDGRHRYVIPGLVDSHVHLPLAGQADQLLVLQLLLVNGITTGINMEGSAEILALRDWIRRDKPDLPTLYTTGVFIQEPAFTNAEQVRREVIAEKAAGYDFIKVHGELTPEAYDALFDTARREHIRVVGHVPSNIGIDGALGRQALIVHAEEFLYSYFQFHRDLPSDPAQIEQMVRDISQRTAESGTWVSPTLSVFRQIISQVADLDALLERPQMQYMPRHLTTGAAVGAPNFGWYPPDNPYIKRWPLEKIPYLRAQYSIMQRLTRGLRDAGVPLLAGSDPFVPCAVPGFSLQDELEQLFAAGLTPYEVLQTATTNAARFLQNAQDLGTVSPGKIADLVILNANPLENVDNIFLQDGILLRGRWFSEDDLHNKLMLALKRSREAAGG